MRRRGFALRRRRTAVVARIVVTGGAGLPRLAPLRRVPRARATRSSRSTTSPPAGAQNIARPRGRAPGSSSSSPTCATSSRSTGRSTACCTSPAPRARPSTSTMPLETLDVELARHAPRARPRARARRPVPARVDERDLRRPARAPAARGLQRQRRPDRAPRGLRRGEAVRRDADHRRTAVCTTSTPRSCASSTRTARGCARPTVASCRTSSCRRSTGKPLTMYGDGTQTRSFCYVDDEVRGIIALFDSDVVDPVNIGNPDEFTMLELAELVREVTGVDVRARLRAAARRAIPTRAGPTSPGPRELLGWEPTVPLRDGLRRMHAVVPRGAGAWLSATFRRRPSCASSRSSCPCSTSATPSSRSCAACARSSCPTASNARSSSSTTAAPTAPATC